MATTGHESELINVGGLKASLQKLKTDIIDGKVESSSVGAASGVASLDESGLVPSTQLPSYVDDVVELLAITDTAPEHCAKGDLYFNTTTSKVVRATGTDTWGTSAATNTDPEKGKIYVNLSDDKTYRWSGSTMVATPSSDFTGIKVGSSGSTLTPSQGVITIPEYETGAQVHIAPTTAEVKSALGTVTTSQGKYLKDDGTWDTPPDTTYVFNTTYDATTNKAATMADMPTTLPASDVYQWAKETIKPSYAYPEIGYTVATAADNGNTQGVITIDGTKPLTIITVTGAVSSVDLASGKAPEAGHSAHVILTAASDYSVSIAHDSTSRVCPNAADISLTIKAGGYVEIDFINVNNKIYVRGI